MASSTSSTVPRAPCACRTADQLGLVVAVDGLGECVIEALTGADGGDRADLGEAFAVPNGRKLRPSIAVTPQLGELGARDHLAISMASRTIVVRMWDATRQPTIVREQASMMKQT